jgi:hypothetical protein
MEWLQWVLELLQQQRETFLTLPAAALGAYPTGDERQAAGSRNLLICLGAALLTELSRTSHRPGSTTQFRPTPAGSQPRSQRYRLPGRRHDHRQAGHGLTSGHALQAGDRHGSGRGVTSPRPDHRDRRVRYRRSSGGQMSRHRPPIVR